MLWKARAPGAAAAQRGRRDCHRHGLGTRDALERSPGRSVLRTSCSGPARQAPAGCAPSVETAPTCSSLLVGPRSDQARIESVGPKSFPEAGEGPGTLLLSSLALLVSNVDVDLGSPSVPGQCRRHLGSVPVIQQRSYRLLFVGFGHRGFLKAS
ncbi:hypothetical protein ACRRTK_020354 [Alexandromys fortis]